MTRKIIADVKKNDLESFGQQIIYRGFDESRMWRSGVNMGDSLEKQQANDFMKKIGRHIENCNEYETGEIVTERKSEGVWIILPMKYGNRVISFAYLRVNNKLMLGDTNSEIPN